MLYKNTSPNILIAYIIGAISIWFHFILYDVGLSSFKNFKRNILLVFPYDNKKTMSTKITVSTSESAYKGIHFKSIFIYYA